MNILHVLSQFEVTGAETFAAALANEQIKNGHTVSILSDTFHTSTQATVIPFPIGKRSVKQRYTNIQKLKEIIRELRIDVVHAHSRAASWVSYFATRKGIIPLVSTVHGRQHVHFSSKHFHMYGEKVLPVSRSIFQHMNKDLHYPIESMRIVGNGLDLKEWKVISKKKKNKHPRIAVIGRLSGPKGDMVVRLLQYVFPAVTEKYPDLEIHIIGGMKNAEMVHDAIERSPIKEQIIEQGHRDGLKKIYGQFDLIVGSGRVAIEALASGCSVMAVGESNYVGLVNDETIDDAIETNFGDTGKRKDPDYSNIIFDLKKFLGNRSAKRSTRGRDIVKQHYDIVPKAKEIQECYAEARSRKLGIEEIPVLMYHRVTDGKPAGTKHGIYVTKTEFEEQLQFLKGKGFTTLTFRHIRDVINGTASLPSKPVILTFDDGYEDNYIFAFPLFKKYQMTGVIFLIGNPKITSNIWDRKGGEPQADLMNSKQIKEMHKEGIEFGSHTLNHKQLTHCTPEDALKEIRTSKKQLEKHLGISIISIAYPYGALNEQHKKMVEQSGYAFGIATDSGRRNFWADLFKIRRIPIFPETSKFQFWKKTSGYYHWYKSVY